MAGKIIRDYYKVLIVGSPGRGKTFSFRNMDANTTGLVHPENKPLNFEKSFKYHAKPKKFAGVMKALEDYSKNPEISAIILESLSETLNMILEEMRANFRGFDVWDNYNRSVSKLLNLIKNIEKEVFITAHYEIINIEGEPEKRVKTKGKEWESMIEKEFAMVLYADSKFENEKPKYFFKLASEGTSAKCPPGIFGEDVYKIPNDTQMVFEKVVEFAKKFEREIPERETINNDSLFT